MTRSPGRLLSASLCGCGIVLALLSAYPFAEMGFVDDFSYVKTALDYARTGHFIYNGWATAMLGWQVPWGALFVKLFGYSFTAVRLSMIPIDLLFIFFFHLCLMRLGINQRNASIGTFTLGFSPVFLPFAASFMTDVSGSFVLVLCLYFCLRALDATSTRHCLMWLALAAASNVAGGTVRQIAWLGTLVLVPSTAWLMRKRKEVLPVALVLWILSVLGIIDCLHWWQLQPYSVPEKIIAGPLTRAKLLFFAIKLPGVLPCMLLLLFPIVAAWIPRFRQLTGKSRLYILGLTLGYLALLVFAIPHARLQYWVIPWLPNTIGAQSMGLAEDMLGTRQSTFTLLSRALLSIPVVVAGFVLFFDLLELRRSGARVDQEASRIWQKGAVLLVPFLFCYCALLVPRGIYGVIWDRYLLGLLPACIALLLLLYQARFNRVLPAWTLLVLGAVALYSIASTHDWFAVARARVQAVNQVRATGVPVTRIQAGFDFDGWTQIQATPSLNESRIVRPAGVYDASPVLQDLAPACRHWFAGATPAVHPDYFVVFQPVDCLSKTNFAPVRYRTWFPPFNRALAIQGRPVPGMERDVRIGK